MAKPARSDGDHLGRLAAILRYSMIFPDFGNTHVYKDVGIIPRLLAKDGSWDVEVASEAYAHSPVGSLRYASFGAGALGSLLYIWQIAPRTDVIQLFHLTWRTVVRAAIYRLRSPRGVVYVKLDIDDPTMQRLERRARSMAWRLVYWISLGAIDLVSTETHAMDARVLGLLRAFRRSRTLRTLMVPNCGFPLTDALSALDANPPRSATVLFLGRLGAYQKALDVLLDAFNIVAQRSDRVRLRLVGSKSPMFDSMFTGWKTRASTDAATRVEIINPIEDRTEVLRTYATADIFVLCSRYEGASLALAEAASCGCRIVATPVGSAPDVFAAGAGGSIVPMDDPPAVAEAILRNLEFEDTPVARRSRARTFGEQYSWTAVVGTLRSRLEEIHEIRRGRQRRGLLMSTSRSATGRLCGGR